MGCLGLRGDPPQAPRVWSAQRQGDSAMLIVGPAVTAEEAVINQKEPSSPVSKAERRRPAAPDGSLSPCLSQPLPAEG